jgi:hypothetical protein
MADNPAFAVIPEIGNGFVTILNNNRDGISGSGYVPFASGASNGSRIAEIVVQTTGTTVAGLARVYISGVGIVGNPLFDEITIAVAAPSASVKATRISTTYNNLVLMSGQILSATNSIGPAQGFNIIALGADL